jgi:DNA (cytosine-5)-methyltransferase 1
MSLVDLFSGCGGFSLGAHQAGYRVAAAFDNDPILASSYPYNFPQTTLVLDDVRTLDGHRVRAAAGEELEGIFGGPPCQGFSDIGRRRPQDPRRQLLWHFFRVVREAQPAFFVMENVRGLAYANSRGVLARGLGLVDDRYSILGPVVLDAAEYGAATRRSRLFVIGIHKDHGDSLTLDDLSKLKRPAATVLEAIGDLDQATYVTEEDGFDVWRTRRRGRPSDYARQLRATDGHFTGHRATSHSKEVAKRFGKVPQGGIDPIGRHPKLSWSGQCPVLRAGTGADKGSYQSVRPIHPEQRRVITVREAARLQGFPDSHRFHSTVWHSFRMLGNSVCPIIARAIFSAIRGKLERQRSMAVAAE